MKLAQNNYLRFSRLSSEATADWTAIKEKIENESADAAFTDPAIAQKLGRFRVLPSVGNKPELGYVREFEDEIPETRDDKYEAVMAALAVPGRTVNSLDARIHAVIPSRKYLAPRVRTVLEFVQAQFAEKTFSS